MNKGIFYCNNPYCREEVGNSWAWMCEECSSWHFPRQQAAYDAYMESRNINFIDWQGLQVKAKGGI